MSPTTEYCALVFRVVGELIVVVFAENVTCPAAPCSTIISLLASKGFVDSVIIEIVIGLALVVLIYCPVFVLLKVSAVPVNAVVVKYRAPLVPDDPDEPEEPELPDVAVVPVKSVDNATTPAAAWKVNTGVFPPKSVAPVNVIVDPT